MNTDRELEPGIIPHWSFVLINFLRFDISEILEQFDVVEKNRIFGVKFIVIRFGIIRTGVPEICIHCFSSQRRRNTSSQFPNIGVIFAFSNMDAQHVRKAFLDIFCHNNPTIKIQQ